MHEMVLGCLGSSHDELLRKQGIRGYKIWNRSPCTESSMYSHIVPSHTVLLGIVVQSMLVSAGMLVV